MLTYFLHAHCSLDLTSLDILCCWAHPRVKSCQACIPWRWHPSPPRFIFSVLDLREKVSSSFLQGLITRPVGPLDSSMPQLFMWLFYYLCEATWFILSGIKAPRKCNFNSLCPDMEKYWISWKSGVSFLRELASPLKSQWGQRKAESCCWRCQGMWAPRVLLFDSFAY